MSAASSSSSARWAELRAPYRLTDHCRTLEQLEAHVLPGVDLFPEAAPPCTEGVGPRLDCVLPRTNAVRGEGGVPTVGVVIEDHRRGSPLAVLRSAEEQSR